MEVFRIVHARYAGSLKASGLANRWNRKGDFVLYAGSSRALSTLEQIVHFGTAARRHDYRINVIEIPEDRRSVRSISLTELPENWRCLDSYPALQAIGSGWARQRASLVLRIPSAVIPQEWNWVLNTEHPDFAKKVRIARVEEYFWDDRLLSQAVQGSRQG
jgi:RES domain-containing protein